MEEGLKPFPIQLNKLGVLEMEFHSKRFGNPSEELMDDVKLGVGVGKFDANQKRIQVFLSASASNDNDGADFDLKVTIVGEFVVTNEDDLPFPIENIPNWAEKDGSALLLPSMRLLLSDITMKTGYRPFVLPLVEVARFKVNPPEVMYSGSAGGSK